jgi:hypothetical protein
MADFRVSSVKRFLTKPAVLATTGGFAGLILLFCSIFYNTAPSEALSITSVNPNSGPFTGKQTVQITTDNVQYKLVDGLIFTNPGTSAPNQYIDTGINQTGNVAVELEFKIADGNTCNKTDDANGTPVMGIFGSWQAWNTNTLYLSRLSGTDSVDPAANNRCAFAIRRGASITETGTGTGLPMGNNTSDTKVHVWKLDGVTSGTTGSWSTDGVVTNLTTPSGALPSANPVSMYLGTIHLSGSSVTGIGLDGTVYYLKLWQNNALVRDMVPVCTDDHTNCGLWDKVSQTFFGNVGNGTFTAGAFLPDEVSVTFDGVAATDINRLSGTVVQATTPAHAVGAVDVVVTINGQKATATKGYTYRLPAISISPDNGPSTGGQVVQINEAGELYERVDGLIFTNPQGTGVTPNQYIDTGIDQVGNVKIEMQFKVADGNTCTSTGDGTGTPNMRIFGSWYTWDANTLYLSRLSGTGSDTANNRCAFAIRRGAALTSETGTGTALPMSGPNTADTDVHTLVLNGSTTSPGTWDSTTLTVPSTALPSAQPLSMYLGTVHGTSGAASGNGLDGTVYYLKIWKDDELVRDMIPVCNSDRTICGMQDKVTTTFYGNVGNGAFSGGSTLPNEVQSVAFGGVAATGVSDLPGNAVQATTPPHIVNLVDVVAVINGQKATLANSYTFRPTIISLTPDLGPTAGGTGFMTAYNSSGRIIVNGDGFYKYNIGATPEYLAANTINNFVNPKFTSYTSSDPFGGVITYSHASDGGTHQAWRVFDKVNDNSTSANWQDIYTSSDMPHTMTWTLPAGKYINISTVATINGYTYHNKEFEVVAGGAAGPEVSLTGKYNLTASARAENTVSTNAAAQSLWTNVVTLKVYSSDNSSHTGMQEVTLSGKAVDLTGAGLTSYPAYFTTAELVTPASAVSIGGTSCASFTVVSNTQLTCQPAAHSAGIFDMSVTTGGIASTVRAPEASHSADDDYDYIGPLEITGVSPEVGSEDGGTEVTISGTGFLTSHRAGAAAQPTVTFDPDGTSADCALVSFTDTEIICTTAAHGPGLVDVKVDNGLQYDTLDDGFLYYELYIGLASSQGSGKVSFSVLPSDTNGNSNFDIVTAKTNLPTGYLLSMKTAANTLICSGLDVCTSHWYSSVPTTGSLGNDSWGHQLNYLANPSDASQPDPAKPPPNTWRPIPVNETTIYTKSSLDPGVTDVGGDKFRLWYGAKASWMMPVTTYRRTVTITAIANI